MGLKNPISVLQGPFPPKMSLCLPERSLCCSEMAFFGLGGTLSAAQEGIRCNEKAPCCSAGLPVSLAPNWLFADLSELQARVWLEKAL